MARVISVEAERFPIAGVFTIARGSKTEAEVITCTIGDGTSAAAPPLFFHATCDLVTSPLPPRRIAVRVLPREYGANSRFPATTGEEMLRKYF